LLVALNAEDDEEEEEAERRVKREIVGVDILLERALPGVLIY